MGREALWGAKLPLVGGLRVLNGGGGQLSGFMSWRTRVAEGLLQIFSLNQIRPLWPQSEAGITWQERCLCAGVGWGGALSSSEALF